MDKEFIREYIDRWAKQVENRLKSTRQTAYTSAYSQGQLFVLKDLQTLIKGDK